jgi:hypothetical protein
MDPILKAARGRPLKRDWCARYTTARTPEEAMTAAGDVQVWLEELASNGALDFAAEHCVAEALRDLGAVREFLRALIRERAS